MSSLSSFISVAYGAASMQALEYTWKEEPILEKDHGRVATRVTVVVEGFVQGSSAYIFQTLLAGLESLSIDGQSLVITGLGGYVEKALSPAQCMEGGPNVGFEILKSGGLLRRDVRLNVTALVVGAGAQTVNSYRTQINQRADGARKVTQIGEVAGVASAIYFNSTILSAFRSYYALPDWTVSFEYAASSDANQTQTKYTITAVENLGALPGGDSTAIVVDGEVTTSFDIDEQQRKTTTYRYDLLISTGDPTALHNSLRPTGSNITVIRESMQVTSIKEIRLRSTFTLMVGDGGSLLLTWTQTLERENTQPTVRIQTFPGANPIVVQEPTTISKATISGSAVGLGLFPEEPDPPDLPLLELPRITYRVINCYEFETSWTYVVCDDGISDGTIEAMEPTALTRPSDEGFYGGNDGDGGDA